MLLFGVRLARLVTWASLWRVVRWAAAVVSVSVGVDGYHGLPHVVSTRYGSLRGLIVTPNHRALRPVAVFLGVPYAAAPVGHLRFMPPKSPPQWSGIRGAETMPPVCPQKLPDLTNKREALKRMPEARFKYLQRLLPLLTNQSEDCLHLNIYTPTKEDLWPSASLERHPVLVYIHGESYEWNSGNPYDGSVLAAYGRVVVVTVNFRLGVLGFLRPTLRESYLSNFGLLDQIAALHWIKENIANFSGDPENVTIFGHGTGAALANLLLISPVAHPSKGLFHRAILMSGSALSRWAMTWNPYKYTIQVAKAVGCPLSDEEDDLARCLRGKSVEELLSVHLKTPPFTTPLGPVIDGIIIKNEPLESMKGDTSVFGKYDLLYGVALAESFHMLSSAEVHSGMSVERRNTLLRAFITNNFDQYASQIFLAVIEYTKGAPMDDEQEVKTQTLETLSDAQITAPVVHMANLHSSINHKSFFYVFNHQSVYGDYPVWQGTVHGEELPYVFGAPLVGGLSHFGLNYSREEVYLSELVMTLWTNFAKTGNPNLPTLHHRYKTPGAGLKWKENIETSWLPYEKHLQHYLHIDLEVMRKHHYRAHQLALWNQVIPNLIKSVPIVPDEEVGPPSTEATPTPSPPAAAGTPISVVILVGICIIIVNCCAMGGVYYQRDKIRHQSRVLRRNLRSRKAEDSEEKASSDAPSPSAQRKPLKKEGSMSDYKVSDETQSDSISPAPTTSKESTLRRKHSQSAQDKVSRRETPKSSLKKTKSGHKRHKSEDGIYSEIGRTAEVHAHPRAGGLSRSPHRTNPTVKFNTVSSGLPPKAITKSNTSISSKTSVKSNASSASAKSTTSRSSSKSKSSERTQKKKNASCQSLPTPEHAWGITPDMTMAERDDPEGRDNRGPPNQQQILAPKQKLNYPKLLPDRPEKVHAAAFVQMKPSPALQQTSVSTQDTPDLKDTVHFVYRKKKNPQRDASTDSCDLIETSNINSTGADAVPLTAMHRAPVTTATVNRKPSHKRNKTQEFRQTGNKEDYGRLRAEEETRLQSAATDGGTAAAADCSPYSGGTKHGTYTSYEPLYIYKDGRVPTPPEAPASLQPGDAAKMFGSFEDSRMPCGSLATLDNTSILPLGDLATQPDQMGQCQTYDNDLMSEPPPPTAAVITAAAHTALATAAAPAFVGASDSNHSAPQYNVAHTPVPAATHAAALRQQSSTASNPDTTRVYEKSENTGTIKRKKSVKKDIETKTVAIQETDKPYDKPLKGVLKQTSAYDRLVPLMAKAPGASPIQTAPGFSSTTTSPKIGGGESRMGEYPYETLHRTPSMKSGTHAATHGNRRKNKHNNQTTTTLTQTNAPK